MAKEKAIVTESINDIVTNLSDEPKAVHIDDDFAEQAGGAWPKGWYAAEILEGYSTRSGKQFTTEDAPSKDGSSRNLRLCFKIKRGDDERTIQETFNYRLTDFTPERMSMIKELRKEYADVKGAWPDKDAQRTNLALVNFNSLQKALGKDILFSADGHILAAQFVGTGLQVRLNVDKNGYNNVTSVRAAS